MLRKLALLATILVSAADVRPAELDLPFHVIVPSSSQLSSISRAELSAIFMRRVLSWPDGSEISPVDQPTRSPVRVDFSRSIHRKSVAYVVRYWHRVIFAGRGVPPVEVRSDAAVVEFVRTRQGAIGYIGSDTPIGDDLKVIRVTE